jgi:hypothetical protein
MSSIGEDVPGVGIGGVSGPTLELPEVDGEREARREDGADFERDACLFVIFSWAMERCSCERGVSLISIGSKATSTGPDAATRVTCRRILIRWMLEIMETITFTRSSNRIWARSVFRDSPTGHWLGDGFAGNDKLATPLK